VQLACPTKYVYGLQTHFWLKVHHLNIFGSGSNHPKLLSLWLEVSLLSLRYCHYYSVCDVLIKVPDRNKKLTPNSHQKIATLNRNSPNFWKWLHLYKNINFFTGDQSFKAI